MISIGLPENRARDLISNLNKDAVAFGLSIACINSPNNVTVSGEENLIDQLKTELDKEKVFARKLRVPLAYHSPQMQAILSRYVHSVGSISVPSRTTGSSIQVPILSSVLGERIDASRVTDPWYWAESTVRPVQFSKALLAMCAQSHANLVHKIDRSHTFASVVDHLVEIGPHATLQGPIRDTLRLSSREKSLGYSSILRRGKPATDTMLQALGELYSQGFPLNLRRANEPEGEKTPRSLLVDLPEYPFDHSQHYWHETRLSRNYRLRRHAPSELLGVQSRDWNASDARWRHFMRLTEMPWAEEHVINGTVLYPGTGMLAMAVEAAKQLTSEGKDRAIDGYTLRDVRFEGAMDLTPRSGGMEVQTSLRKLESKDPERLTFEFTIRTYSAGDWALNCRGFICVETSGPPEGWARGKLIAQRTKAGKKLAALLPSCKTPVPSTKMYSFLAECGYDYGKSFQAAQNQHCNEEHKQATADVALFSSSDESHVFHPVSLDAILHLCFTAFSSGGTVPMATSIPTHIRCMWISNEGLQWRPGRDAVTACTSVTTLTSRGFDCSGGAFDTNSSGDLRLWYEGLELTSVTHTPAGLSVINPKQWSMFTDCKVAIDMLSDEEVGSLLENLHPAEQDMSDFSRDLELLVEMTLDRLIDTVDPALIDDQNSWKRQYFSWAQHHHTERRRQSGCGKEQSQSQTSNTDFQELINRLNHTNQVGRVYSEVASKLLAMFRDEVYPLDLLVHSGLLKTYYQELAGYRCAKQVASYVDLLAHQNPGMKILEVGGGTAATTRNLISTLCSGSDGRSGSLRCARYDFTDISRTFTKTARKEFASFESQMTFSVLDVERDLTAQGFKEAEYDVVVADNVLHATPHLARSLQYIRKALKPGGKLLMYEPLRSSGWTLGFVFGVFPGWWLGEGEGRNLSPAIPSEAWDEVLASNGFTGTDLVLRDFDDDVAHQVGWLISSTTGDKPQLDSEDTLEHCEKRHKPAVIIIDDACPEQVLYAERLVTSLNDTLDMVASIQSIDTTTTIDQKDNDELVIFLADYGLPFLASLNDESYTWMKSLIRGSRRLLWVKGSGAWDVSPDHGLLDGMARTLRSEYYELQLVALVLDIGNESSDKIPLIMRVAKEMISRKEHQPYEQEYLEIKGCLHTRRLVEASDLKSAMNAKLVPYEITSTPLDGESRFELATLSSDPNANPCFVRPELPTVSQHSSGELGEYLDIIVRAVCLQSQHRSTALGQANDSSSTSYYYCSGTVLGGSAGASFLPGDRVLAPCSGPLRSHIRVPARQAARLPDDLSFSAACAASPFFTAAYHALFEVARLGDSDRVLVHNGASPLGQAALQMLSDEGVAEIWTTASSLEDCKWISEHMGVREDHILPETWFESQPMILSQWEPKFDIVLSLDSGSSLPVLMNYVRSGGRYISFRAGTATKHNAQWIHCAPPSISVTTIHMGEAYSGHSFVSPQALQRSVALSRSLVPEGSRIQATHFPASSIVNALKHLQKADKDTIVVELNETDKLDVSPSFLNPVYKTVVSVDPS